MRIPAKEMFNTARINNRKILLLIFSWSVFHNATSQTGSLIEISGQVRDQEKNVPLPDVSVQIKGLQPVLPQMHGEVLYSEQRLGCLLSLFFLR